MRQRNIVAISIFAGILLVLAFFQTPLMTQAREYVWSWWVTLVAKGSGLNVEESKLTDQLVSLRADNIRLKAELRDYRVLRQQLAAPSLTDWQPLPAAVVGRPIDAFHTGFAISKGFADGVSVGAPVVTNNSFLVGVVEEVQERSALVRTLLHPDSQFSVMNVPEDIDQKIAQGLLQSRFRTSLHIVSVPRDVVLSEGQNIVVDSFNQQLPVGLVVGTVQEIHSPEHEAYQEARIEVPYDLDELRAVSVLIAP